MEDLSSVGSLVAVLMSAWALWRSERTRSAALRASWDDAREFRQPFWEPLERAYEKHRASSNGTLPTTLKGLIGAAGLPPGVPLGKGRQIKNWGSDYSGKLGTDQRNIWNFVEAVYPNPGGSGGTMDNSLIDADLREAFHEARRKLSTFLSDNAKSSAIARSVMSSTIQSAKY
jgi:hypothetical protein